MALLGSSSPSSPHYDDQADMDFFEHLGDGDDHHLRLSSAPKYQKQQQEAFDSSDMLSKMSVEKSHMEEEASSYSHQPTSQEGSSPFHPDAQEAALQSGSDLFHSSPQQIPASNTLEREASFSFALPADGSSLSPPDSVPGSGPSLAAAKSQVQTSYKQLDWSFFPEESCDLLIEDNTAEFTFVGAIEQEQEQEHELQCAHPSEKAGGAIPTADAELTVTTQMSNTQNHFQSNATYGDNSAGLERSLDHGFEIYEGPPLLSSSENQQLQSSYSTIYYSNGAYDDHSTLQPLQENPYPGWYYDYNLQEWREIQGYSSSGVSEVWTFDAQNSEERKSESASSVKRRGDSFSEQNNKERAILDQYHGVAAVSANQSCSPKQQDGTRFNQQVLRSMKPHIQDANLSWQQPTTNDVGVQEQLSWEQLYPNWYYDYQAQEWRERTDQMWQLGETKHESQQSSIGLDLSNEKLYETPVFPLDHANSLKLSPNQQPLTFSDQVIEQTPIFQPVILDNQIHKSWPSNQVYENGYNMDHYQVPNSGAHYELQQTPLSYKASHSNVAPRTVIEALQSTAGQPIHALVAFGFGGKLIYMKQREPVWNAQDQVFTSAQNGTSGTLVSCNLGQLVMENVNKGIRHSGISYFTTLTGQGFIGPLAGGNVATKDLFKWIDERVANCDAEGLAYSNPEALRVLWCLLRITCQHYGNLRSPISTTSINLQGGGPEMAVGSLLASVRKQAFGNMSSLAMPNMLQALPTEQQLQLTANEMKNLLVAGKRKEALQCAQDGHLWGPALALAWQLGEKFYFETVTLMAQCHLVPGSALRTICLLLAGKTTEVFAAKSPTTASPALASSLDGTGGMLENWLENLAIIAANRTKGDEQVIMHLGDCLWKAYGEVAGAHACYLVADTSFESFSGSARLCLLGADHFKHPRTFSSPESIQRTELYEYAKVLGNPQFILLPFQPYKLIYAHMLAEAGKLTEAIRYCQAVSRTLKNAGRATEIEYCRQAATALEDRLRLHTQGGYSNLAPAKFVGKLMSTLDSTIHKIIGGPPSSSYATQPKIGLTSTKTSPTPLVPSSSTGGSDLLNGGKQPGARQRSISEPSFTKSPKQEEVISDLHSPQLKHQKHPSFGGGYFSRFGSQFFAKAVGLIRHSKEAKLGEDNKFYYDEKLKRWIEEGADPASEEVALPPPPTTPNFFSSNESSLLGKDTGANIQSHTSLPGSGNLSSIPGLPPIPPGSNQFSARARFQGVQSRYVDTFNAGAKSASVSKSIQSPLVPISAMGLTSAPSNFFVPTATVASEINELNVQLVDSRHLIEAGSVSNSQSEMENASLMPRNLSSSFMAMPGMRRHYSADNVAINKSGDCNDFSSGLLGDSTRNSHGYASRAFSWNGFAEANEIPASTSGMSMCQPLHGRKETNHFSVVPNYASLDGSVSTLPSPPLIHPPQSFIGMEGSSHLSPATVVPSLYGEMQEVEL